MDVKQLRLLTIAIPIAFLVAVELFSIFVLGPMLGTRMVPRLPIVFLILAAGVVPFSSWVFAVIERQQRQVGESAERIRTLNTQLERRVDQLATANQEILRRNRELAAVNTAIRAVSSALDLPQVLQNITDAARSLVNCKYAALGVADEQGELVTFVTSGITQEERESIGPLPRGHGLLGALIQEGTPLRIPDIARDPRSHGFPPNHPPMKSLLGVPILFQGKAVGDLYLTDKLDAAEFTQADQSLLMLLANHAAVAIENAGLYDEVRRARDRLQLWNEELEAKVVERTKEIERYSKELTTRVLQAQEEERKRIARELHDETAQSLSTLLITLDLLEATIPENAPALQAGLDRARALARRTLDETRALSHDLRPTILDDVGLVAAIRWFAEEFTRTYDVPVLIEAEEPRQGLYPGAPSGTPRLSPEMEIALFRIAQEALTNAGKYAEASRVRLALWFDCDRVKLEIADNGKGFDLQSLSGPSRDGGLGLYGMRERVALLGGELQIETAPGSGTRIKAAAPVPMMPVER
jgi:signal transduction histidine kinase